MNEMNYELSKQREEPELEAHKKKGNLQRVVA